MVSDGTLILLAALVALVLVGVAVAHLERSGDETKAWKRWLGGGCGAFLAGGSVAELTTGFGEWAETHPIFTGTLTGAALLGITVLVIDSLIKRADVRPWRGPLGRTWSSVLRRGRRGATDLRSKLPQHPGRVDVDIVPEPKDTVEAYEVARELSTDLTSRVGGASLFAFASDRPELGEWMQELSTAADTLQRTLERYSKEELSHEGEERSRQDVVDEWRDYIWWLVWVDAQSTKLKFASPLKDTARNWLVAEQEGHTPPNAPRLTEQ